MASGSSGNRGTEPPGPGGVRTVDELSARLRSLQTWSGVSFREIHRRVVRSRKVRGIAELPAYNTVYRCLLPGRSRLDVELVVDIASVLLGDEAAAAQWRQAHQVVSGLAADAAVVTVSDTVHSAGGAFVGRAGEVTEALAALGDPAYGLVLVEGMPGVGKTTYATHLARRLLARGGWDVRLSVNLRGYDPDRPPADPAAVLDGFLRILGVPGSRIHPLGLAARSALFRDQLAGRRALVLLDNAASDDQIRPLLPDGDGSVGVVTSRVRLSGPLAAHRVRLDVLAPDESVAMLRQAAGRERIEADPGTAVRIAALAGHLPLALAVLAGRIAASPDWTLADQLERLVEHQARLRLDDGVALALSLSYDGLGPDAQRLLRMLALHPGRDADETAAAALAGTNLDTGRRLLVELTDANLLQRRGAGRYEMHDLVRILAADRARDDDPAADRRAATGRLLDHYRFAARTAVLLHAPHRAQRWTEVPVSSTPQPVLANRDAARAWLDSERPNLIATALYAATHGRPSYTTDLSMLLQHYLDTSGLFHDAETLHHAAVRCAPDLAARGRSYNSLGTVYWRLGRYVEGRDCYRHALELSRAVGNRIGEASGLSNVALGHFRLGRYADAIEHHRQALAIFAAEENLSGISTTSAGLGWGELRLGRAAVALEHFRHALAVSRRMGDGTFEEAYALANVAAGFEALGRLAPARRHYQQALELSRRLGFPCGEADALNGLGRLYLADGMVDCAVRCHADALELSQKIGNRPYAIEVRNDLGIALRRTGRLADAVEQHRAAGVDAQALEERYELARAYCGVAAVLRDRGQSTAQRYWHRALTLFTALGTPEACQVLRELGGGRRAPQPSAAT